MSLSRRFSDAYALLMPNRAFSICAASVAGVFLSGAFSAEKAVLLLLSFLFSYCSQAVFNNICDIESDKINKSGKRLLADDRNLAGAYALVLALTLAGAVLAFLVSGVALAMNIAFVSLLTFYSAFAKGKWYLSYPLLVTTHMVLPMLSGYLTGGIIDARIITIIAFIYVTEPAAFTIKDYKDIEGDRKAGMQTLPIAFGVDKASLVTCAGLAMPALALFYISESLRPSLLFLIVYGAIALARIGFALHIVDGMTPQKAQGMVKNFRIIMLAQMLSWLVF